VGYSLIFIPVSLSQWAWNTCSHGKRPGREGGREGGGEREGKDSGEVND
jgi:hypothetical protein